MCREKQKVLCEPADLIAVRCALKSESVKDIHRDNKLSANDKKILLFTANVFCCSFSMVRCNSAEFKKNLFLLEFSFVLIFIYSHFYLIINHLLSFALSLPILNML